MGQTAAGYCDKAWEQLKKAIASSPGRRNLGADILALDDVLKNYKPANDIERTLNEICKSERARLVK